MPADSFDQNAAQSLLAHVLALHEQLGPQALEVTDELRAQLQGLALLDGVPDEVSRSAMSAARALKDVGEEHDVEGLVGA